MKRPEETLHRACLEYLRASLRYDPETGVFTWAKDNILAGGAKVVSNGDRAGTINADGYRQIQFKIDGRKRGFKEHRLAWLLVHGKWPTQTMLLEATLSTVDLKLDLAVAVCVYCARPISIGDDLSAARQDVVLSPCEHAGFGVIAQRRAQVFKARAV
jgi:hypothetical protein